MTRIGTVLVFAAIALAAAAAGVYLSLWHSKSAVPFSRSAQPKAVPALQFEDASGRSRSLADFRGKVVLLNIWATWCAPCREEMPTLDRLQGKLGGPAFEVVALSVDQQRAMARRFFDEIGVKALGFYIDPSAKAAFHLDAAGLPATLLIDREGREIGRHLGAVRWDAPDTVAALQRYVGSVAR